MDPQVVEWAFKAIITGCIIHAVGILSKLRDSIDSLNIRVAVVIEQVSAHEKEIFKHHERIKDLERIDR